MSFPSMRVAGQCGLALAICALLGTSHAWAQQAARDEGNQLARSGTKAAPPKGGRSFRRLAAGVMRTIDPEPKAGEQLSRHELTDITSQDPSFGERPWSPNLAKDIRYSHDAWTLEFSFKPVRFIEVDVPNSAGKFDRKLLWYMVYKVRNVSDKPIRFIPRFTLHSHDANKYYPDRILSFAIDPIRQKEDPNRPLLNSVEISEKDIPVSGKGADKSVWGVVTWEDIDPGTDRFSIFVQGLSNAYYWNDNETKGSKHRYYRKMLQLNFWRPGDDEHEHENEIRFGIPGEVDYAWVYK